MKEISEVISQYEDKVKANEINHSYNVLLDRTKKLVKKDLCEFKDVDDLDNYTRVDKYKIPVAKDNNLYHLYKNNINNKYYFIFKRKLLPNDTSGIIISFDHLSEEEIQKIENFILVEEISKSDKIGNDAGIFILVSVIYIIFALIVFVGFMQDSNGGVIFSVPLFVIAVLLYRIAKLMDKVESLSKRVKALDDK